MGSGKIEIKTENLKNCIEEMKPLLENHCVEVHAHPEKILFDPNYDQYLMLNDAGVVHTITVRSDGELIGYFLSIITENLHYKNDKYAVNDVLYLDPKYRGGKVAYKMFQFAEEEYKKIGVKVFTLHMKTKLPFENLCEAVGMVKTEFLYSKYIGD